MRIVVALGGNALIQRSGPMTAEAQRANVKIAARALAPVAIGNELVLAHGNGPQVGLLALQAAAFTEVEPYPLDVLGAQTEGMIGYMIEQELGNVLPEEVPFATILTQVEVDPADPAFQNPTKPIGPQYGREEAERLAHEHGWTVGPDNGKYRRLVPSPRPLRIFELRVVEWLVERGVVASVKEAFDRFRFGDGAAMLLVMFAGLGLLLLLVYMVVGRWGYGDDH